MQRQTMFVAAAIAAALATPAAFAGGVTVFNFGLSGDQEATPNDSEATGDATLTYDASTMTFDIDVATTGIALDDLMGVGANSTPIHLHLAPPGENGGIVVDLGIVSSFMDAGGGMLTFNATDVAIGGPQGAGPASDPEENETALFNGNLYLNIHTMDFPGGEIRGQVVPAPSGLALGALALAGAARRRRR